MAVTYDPAKRLKTLEERGLDFADADEVFAGRHTILVDDRRDYGETRYISAGFLRGRMVGSGLDRTRRYAPRHLDEASP